MSSMGFLGAMAGLGQGMQHYSALLGEKRKEDWKEQAEMAKAQRLENLTRLQNQLLGERETKLAGIEHTNRLGVLNATVDANVKQAEQMRTRTNQWIVEDANNPDLIAAEKAKQDREIAYKVQETEVVGEAELKLLNKKIETQAAIASKLSKEQRQEALADLDASGVLDGFDKTTAMKMKVATLYPDLAPLLKTKEVSGEVLGRLVGVYKDVYTESFDNYDGLPTPERRKVDSAAKKAGQDPREYYATARAITAVDTISLQIGLKISDKDQEEDGSSDFNKLVQAVRSGETNEDEMAEKGLSSKKIQEVLEAAGKQKTKPTNQPEEVDVEPDPVQQNVGTLTDIENAYRKYTGNLTQEQSKQIELTKKQKEQAIQTKAVQLYNEVAKKRKGESTVSSYDNIPRAYKSKYTKDAKKELGY